jgi:aminoglycoside phosphotransferase (APT) family kinase protein
MSTIGHPLSDLSNLLTPFYTARIDRRRHPHAHPGFLPGATPGLPTPDEVASLYFSVAAAGDTSARARARELRWAQAFNIFRLAAITQGIAARMAARQASSEQARQYAHARFALAEFAWELVQGAAEEEEDGADADAADDAAGGGKSRL